MLRASPDFPNDTLTLRLPAGTCGDTGQDGAFQRLQGEYDITDSIESTGGVVLNPPGDLPGFRNVGGSDRLLLEVEYNFPFRSC